MALRPRSITAADAIYMLGVTGLYNSPQLLQGYAADAAFDTDSVQNAQTVMGVDGIMSAGYVPVERSQTITLQADSPSVGIFDQWAQANETGRTVYFAFGTIILPATQRKYALTRGVLMTYPPMPGVGKTLKPVSYGITWQSITPAPF
jgi:hypothetical protein